MYRTVLFSWVFMTLAQGHTMLTCAAYAGEYAMNREMQRVLVVELLLDRPQGQIAPAVDL